MNNFSRSVLCWYDQHGRKNLPWQQNITPYRVWLSEVMLQQTQVKTVIPYFEKFTTQFENVEALANASEDQVLKLWSGLGYYARGRNLHKAARQICDKFKGDFPDNMDDMQSLAGVGRSTAAAILSIAFEQPQAILDGNVKRVLTRYYALEGWTGKAAVLKQLWHYAEQTTPESRSRDYTQAIMDLGATLCTRSKPACKRCPLQADCIAYAQGNMTDYPTPKKKKILPEKHTIMLILQNKQQQILMQKRPPTGIWGGLWCFPQFETDQQMQEWLSINTINALVITKMTEFSHTFSHFRLYIQPLILSLETPLKTGVMEDDNILWYNPSTEFEGGLAAPVTKLLQELTS